MSAFNVLGRLGDAGLFAPLLAVAIGFLLPPLASVGHALLVPAVILMFTMSVAMVEPGRLHWPEAWPVIALAMCNLLLSPLVAHGIAGAVGLDAVGGWLVLVAACPAAGAASMVARLLGLAMRPMLLAQLVCFFALPVTAPLVAGFLLDGVVVDPWVLLWRMAVIVALPSLLGVALRIALRDERRRMAFRPMRGLGILGLCGVGLAIAHGLSAKLSADIPWAACGLGVVMASLVGAGLGAATGLLSGRLGGAPLGKTFALGGAVRNVSLLWSATIGISSPEGEAVMMLGTLWTFIVPALLGLRCWRPYRLAGLLAMAVVALALSGAAGRIGLAVLAFPASGARDTPEARPRAELQHFEADRRSLLARIGLAMPLHWKRLHEHRKRHPLRLRPIQYRLDDLRRQ